jgi:hypothetical protein
MLFAAKWTSFFLIIYIHGGVWVYSVQNCSEKFQAEFPIFAVDYTHFKKTLDRAVHLFRGTSRVHFNERYTGVATEMRQM